MLNKIYNKIYNALIWRWNLYLWHPINKRINNSIVNTQRNNALLIYDSIINGEAVPEIRKKISLNISTELKAVINKLEKVGYIDIPPLKDDFKISVIIPHYNHQHLIGETLSSLYNQTEIPDEIIIVDDVSKDFEALEKIVFSFKATLNVKLVKSKEKLYTGLAIQKGIDFAENHIVSVHGADDISHPQRLEIIKNIFKENPSLVMLNDGVTPFTGKFSTNNKSFSKEDVQNKLLGVEPYIFRMREIFENQLFAKRLPSGVYRAGSFGPHEGIVGTGNSTFNKGIFSHLRFSTKDELKDAFTNWEDFELNTYVFLSTQSVLGVNIPLYYYRTDSSTYIGSWVDSK